MTHQIVVVFSGLDLVFEIGLSNLFPRDSDSRFPIPTSLIKVHACELACALQIAVIAPDIALDLLRSCRVSPASHHLSLKVELGAFDTTGDLIVGMSGSLSAIEEPDHKVAMIRDINEGTPFLAVIDVESNPIETT